MKIIKTMWIVASSVLTVLYIIGTVAVFVEEKILKK